MTAPGALNSAMGSLYVVATPIGNLDDISARAMKVLRDVALIAAEDTRHSLRLLQHFGITTPLAACHEHNERDEGSRFIAKLLAGEDVALMILVITWCARREPGCLCADCGAVGGRPAFRSVHFRGVPAGQGRGASFAP